MIKMKVTFYFAILSLISSCRTQTADKPNILIILVDDMGYSDIGCFGGENNTPNLDKLAENGVRFTQFYNTARSCPSRASLLTGLYPHQAGLGNMAGNKTELPGYTGELNNSCVTVEEVMKSAGYSTYMAGKWHVAYSLDGSDKHNWPLQRGFDKFFGTINGGGNYYNPNGLIRDNDFIKADSNFYYTDQIAGNSIKYIADHIGSGIKNPFFLYVAFTSPHWPLHAPDSVINKYHGKYTGGWDSLRDERLNRQIKLGLFPEGYKLSERDPEAPAWDTVADREWQEKRMEVYAAQVEIMDRGIGKIIEILKQSGQLDNTIIFFLSDNGGAAEELTQSWKKFLINLYGGTQTRYGEPIEFCNNPQLMPGSETTMQSVGLPWANAQNTPFRLFKRYIHEGGISAPLIIHWPEKIKNAGKLVSQPCMLMDIMATCIAVSGAEYPQTFNGNIITPLQGFNLMPVVLKGKPTDRKIMCWEHENNKAIREGKWKLVSRAELGEWELYNINNDRIESVDLSEIYPDVVIDLAEKWGKWAIKSKVLPKPDKK